MDEKTKYEKVWRECARYGKNWTDAGLGRPYKIPFLKRARIGSSVIDFGCGNGSSLDWLKMEGFSPFGVDIAKNALTKKREDVVIGDLREPGLITQPAKYGICTDVMEHIPTSDVSIVLENIAEVIREGVLFGIARLPDKDGDELGLKLHLTIKNQEWWDELILRYFRTIELIRYDDGVYILWAIK